MGGICKGEKVHTGQTLGSPLVCWEISWDRGAGEAQTLLVRSASVLTCLQSGQRETGSWLATSPNLKWALGRAANMFSD